MADVYDYPEVSQEGLDLPDGYTLRRGSWLDLPDFYVLHDGKGRHCQWSVSDGLGWDTVLKHALRALGADCVRAD